ncbi:pentapeptide repeat-containing protein [Algimonas porphyrae]|uniref:pentapeptide repeat-containing protein n=1 Tax=Algimonas porphyrae TaxID=1128113 RepID=UPI0024E044CC|nr:pentapeptide repeat-containing protein [Algimonas porphyrae]
MRYYSQATSVRVLLGVTLLALPLITFPMAASGQLRVDTRIYASSSSCAQCDLSGKRMNGMTLKNANFAGSLFNNSNLSGGKLHGSDLTGAHFRKAMLYGVQGEQVIMRGAVLEDATLTEANLSHSTMRQANLHRAELTRGTFTDNDFQSANLMSASASSVDFTRSNFDRARLDNADLSSATLDGGQFTGVRFGFANLEKASLDQTNLSDADLTHVVGLTQEQLDQACGNMNTRLPDGLNLGYCEGAMSAPTRPQPPHHPRRMREAMQGMDRAILDIETLLAVETDGPTRSRLQRVHRDLTQSREAMDAPRPARPPRR